ERFLSMHDTSRPTIGILFPGEMGSRLGRLFVTRGFRVVTTVQGRSPRTRDTCAEAGLDALEDLGEVVAASQVIISLVTPGAALEVASRCGDVAATLAHPPTYVDANS